MSCSDGKDSGRNSRADRPDGSFSNHKTRHVLCFNVSTHNSSSEHVLSRCWATVAVCEKQHGVSTEWQFCPRRWRLWQKMRDEQKRMGICQVWWAKRLYCHWSKLMAIPRFSQGGVAYTHLRPKLKNNIALINPPYWIFRGAENNRIQHSISIISLLIPLIRHPNKGGKKFEETT